jgi:hypothetical protein
MTIDLPERPAEKLLTEEEGLDLLRHQREDIYERLVAFCGSLSALTQAAIGRFVDTGAQARTGLTNNSGKSHCVNSAAVTFTAIS